MADPHWTSYVGMITGIVGAITGISGAVMGYVGYRKSNEIKSLDLRLELRKSINDFESSLSQIEKLLPYVNKSRERVASAIGNYHSGAMVIWKEAYEKDQLELNQISDEAQKINNELVGLSPAELEAELVRIHKFQNQLNVLEAKYDKALVSDDKERERIKNRHEPR